MNQLCGILDESADSARAALAKMSSAGAQVSAFHHAAAGLAMASCVSGGPTRSASVGPLLAERGKSALVLEGELYNADELTSSLATAGVDRASLDSHAAILLAGWMHAGPQFLRAVAGSFAAAVWDGEARRLLLITDQFGSRTLYYADQGERTLFSTSLKALTLADPSVAREPSWQGIAQFFFLGHYWLNDTSLAGASVVPAATVLAWQPGKQGSHSERYWQPGAPANVVRDRVDWQQQIDAALTKAVARSLPGALRPGLSLSGGLDARTILALVDGRSTPLMTVCLGMPGSLDERSSRRLAALAGSDHHHYQLGGGFLENFDEHLRQMVRLTEGQYLSQCIVMPTLPLYRELGIDVLLRGHVGELMHMRKAYAYSLDNAALAAPTDAAMKDWLTARMKSCMLPPGRFSIFKGDLARDLAQRADDSVHAAFDQEPEGNSPVDRIWRLFVSQRIRRETTLSMRKFRSVVEVRLPYLDADLVELLLAAPTDLKLDETLQSYMLARHRPEFLRVTNSNTGAAVDAGNMSKRLAGLRMKVFGKLGLPGYQPYERLGLWLRRELAGSVRNVLLGDACLDRGTFDADGVRHYVDEHLSGRANHTFLIMAMMIFELGQRYLGDEPGFEASADLAAAARGVR